MFIETFWFEAILIVALILLNGFLSGSEIAVISSRRSRIAQIMKTGKKSAHIVDLWLKNPEIFLATVQVGITLVGVLASAVGGAAAIEFLKPKLTEIKILSKWAEPIAISIIVIPITYLSLIFGELVPKSFALIYKEKMALLVSWPIHWFSILVKPLVAILTVSTKCVLFCLGQKKNPKELFVTEEEIRYLIKEGGDQGVFDSTEQQMIPKVFDFAEKRVKEIMIPREKVTALNVKTPQEQLLNRVAEEAYTRFPVYRDDLDHIIGILHMKDYIYALTLGKLIILQDLVRPSVFVRDTEMAKNLLSFFQKRRIHMAIVQDGNNRTVGLVTLEDIIETMVGDIKDEHDAP